MKWEKENYLPMGALMLGSELNLTKLDSLSPFRQTKAQQVCGYHAPFPRKWESERK